MRKVICDRCGAEITSDRIGYVAAGWRAVSDNSLLGNNPYQYMDFCEECMKDIINVIDFNFKVEVGEAVIDDVEDPVEGEPEVVDEAVEEEPEEDEEDQKEDENAYRPDEEATETEPEPEPVYEKKKRVDLRKLRELVKAGKTAKEIADHFGISIASYYNYRKKAEALYIAGRL